MPNRILKESICYSDDIDKLSPFEEVVFYRLVVNCDDYGRLDARASFLKSKLFVTKQGVTEKNVSDAVSKLASIGLVRLYKVDGKPFLLFPKWNLHQRIRNSKEKYPAPADEGFLEVSENCGEPRQAAANSGYNPIQSESDPNTNPNPNAHAPGEAFDRFWAAYPKKKSKVDAVRAFQKIGPDEALLGTMLAAIEMDKRSKEWQKDGGQYIPYPATWLSGRRWEDEGTRITQFHGMLEREYTQEELRSRIPDPIAEMEKEE